MTVRQAVTATALVCGLAVGTQARTAAPAGNVVRVAAAADLRFVLEDAAQRLAARQPPIVLQATYASSGVLHTQLQQRAPFDVFLSADSDYPADLVQQGIAAPGDMFNYARGHLVLWVLKASPLNVERDGLRSLQRAEHIAIANPATAPYGRAAQAALKSAGLWDRLQPHIVLGENVAQTAQFVESGAADAGLIARSVAGSAAMRGKGRTWDVPENLYPPIVQAGLIVSSARSRAAAVAFRDYLLGADGRQLLEQYGFARPPR